MAVEYATNFKGERSTKLFNGTKTHYIYDLQGQLIAEADNTGAIQKEYIYLNGQRLATVTNGAVYYDHTDHLDTPIALTDQAGLTQWKASYTPFGKAIVEINNLENNIRFPGQYFDSETGLHYNYFRDYDPEIGRYIQSDPIGLNGGINTYGYVGGNPINKSDMFGLKNPNSSNPNCFSKLIKEKLEDYQQHQSDAVIDWQFTLPRYRLISINPSVNSLPSGNRPRNNRIPNPIGIGIGYDVYAVTYTNYSKQMGSTIITYNLMMLKCRKTKINSCGIEEEYIEDIITYKDILGFKSGTNWEKSWWEEDVLLLTGLDFHVDNVSK